jgi:periplasmic protein TonB
MFEDSLFATNASPRPQRGVAAVISFGVQAVLLGVLVLVPLIYTDALPLGSLKNYVEIPLPPTRPAPEAAPPQEHRNRTTSSEMIGTTVLQPRTIPPEIHQIDDRGAAPPTIDPYAVISGPIGDSRNSSALQSILASNMRPAPPPAPSIQRKPLVISGGVTEGLLIHKITPAYPPLARQIRVQGPVVMRAIIGRNGTIQDLQVLSGHPMLTKAAVDAVQQWRYRPYLLNNEPVEVETQIVVNFKLGG